jgi:hypothetical protein
MCDWKVLVTRKGKLSVGVVAVLWGIWKTRNLVCFENKWLKEPFAVWIKLWVKMQVKGDPMLELQMYAILLKRVTSEILSASRI